MKKWHKIVIVIVLLLCLIPLPLRYKDGGTVKFKAVLYSLTRWHQLDDTMDDGFRDGWSLDVLGVPLFDGRE